MNTISWWNVDLGPQAEEAAAKAVRGRHLSMGSLVADFEQRMGALLHVPHVVASTNGTSALMLAMLEAGIGPGSEVIVPERTWIATAHAAHLLGAKLVLVDVQKDKPLMDVDAFAAAISPASRAVVPVHLNGRGCDMPRIRAVAQNHGIAVIEDAAQALFSRSAEGAYLGLLSRSGCFSMSISKLITCGQGGFVVTHDADVAARLRTMRTQGTSDIMEARWLLPGGNFRFTDIHAAIALTQMDRLEERMQQIRTVFAYYAEAITDTAHLRLQRDYAPGELPLYPEVLCSERETLVRFLTERNIQVRTAYPCLYKAPQFFHDPSGFPHATSWEAEALFLPCGPDRTEEELKRVTKSLQEWQSIQH